MYLKPGTLAPDFAAQTFAGKTVKLSDLRGKKTWLSFYRYASCPLCHQHLFEVTQKASSLKLNRLNLLSVFETQRVKFGKLEGRKFPEFPMLADPHGELYSLYGVPTNRRGAFHPMVALTLLKAAMNGFFQWAIDGPYFRIPAHFLIDADGVIQEAFYGRHIADHIPWSTVKKFLSKP